jgi:hypothetical protein
MWQAADGHEDALSWADGVTTLPDPLSVAGVQQKPAAILKHKRIPASDQEAYLKQIDRNYAAMCASEGWRKDGGQFAKGLETLSQPFNRSKA